MEPPFALGIEKKALPVEFTELQHAIQTGQPPEGTKISYFCKASNSDHENSGYEQGKDKNTSIHVAETVHEANQPGFQW